jgi:hypothetical protein
MERKGKGGRGRKGRGGRGITEERGGVGKGKREEREVGGEEIRCRGKNEKGKNQQRKKDRTG